MQWAYYFQERQANAPDARICKGNVHCSTHMIPMEYSLVEPQDCKKPAGTQQNKPQPNISSLWTIALLVRYCTKTL